MEGCEEKDACHCISHGVSRGNLDLICSFMGSGTFPTPRQTGEVIVEEPSQPFRSRQVMTRESQLWVFRVGRGEERESQAPPPQLTSAAWISPGESQLPTQGRVTLPAPLGLQGMPHGWGTDELSTLHPPLLPSLLIKTPSVPNVYKEL